METITAARITPLPESMGDPMPEVFVTVGGNEVPLFTYYPDEITFTADEFIGLTIDQARHLKFEKDRNYLRS